MSKLYQCIESKVVREEEHGIVLETKPYIAIRTIVDRYTFDENGEELNYIKDVQRKKIIEEIYGQYISELKGVVDMIWRDEDRIKIIDKINNICYHMWGKE